MTKEEKMAIAKQVAELERRGATAVDQSEIDEVAAAMSAIAAKITSMEDMAEIDKMVQSLLNS